MCMCVRMCERCVCACVRVWVHLSIFIYKKIWYCHGYNHMIQTVLLWLFITVIIVMMYVPWPKYRVLWIFVYKGT